MAKGTILQIERAFRPDAERVERALRCLLRLAQEAKDYLNDTRDQDPGSHNAVQDAATSSATSSR